jgi:hypothetical protein
MEPVTLPFDTFWAWLTAHPNCILRAGTLEAILYDDDDFHWHFGHEDASTLLVQVIRGKRLVGEILIRPDQITYVEGMAGAQEGEFVFELIAETETERLSACHFVLTHGYEHDTDHLAAGRVH